MLNRLVSDLRVREYRIKPVLQLGQCPTAERGLLGFRQRMTDWPSDLAGHPTASF